jgi:hypothetical protein
MEKRSNSKENWFSVLVLRVLHIGLVLFTAVGPFVFRKNIPVLLFYVGVCLIITYQWSIVGDCIVSRLENHLEGDATKEKNFTNEWLERYSGLDANDVQYLSCLVFPLMGLLSLTFIYTELLRKKCL